MSDAERPGDAKPSDNLTGNPVVHLVRGGRYPHVVVRGMGTSVRQSQVLSEVSCGLCLGAAEAFLGAVVERQAAERENERVRTAVTRVLLTRHAGVGEELLVTVSVSAIRDALRLPEADADV